MTDLKNLITTTIPTKEDITNSAKIYYMKRKVLYTAYLISMAK